MCKHCYTLKKNKYHICIYKSWQILTKCKVKLYNNEWCKSVSPERPPYLLMRLKKLRWDCSWITLLLFSEFFYFVVNSCFNFNIVKALKYYLRKSEKLLINRKLSTIFRSVNKKISKFFILKYIYNLKYFLWINRGSAMSLSMFNVYTIKNM